MKRQLVNISLLVRDYDEAIEFYTRVLNFKLVEDTLISDTKRFVRISPSEHSGTCLLLAKATTPEQESRIGNQTGGKVFLFIHTDSFEEEVKRIQKHNLKIVRGPVEEEFGKVLVFEDLYGNKIDLIEPK